MSSHDGSRSARQSKRYSVTALYLSMSANERDLEIEDDLAKGISLQNSVNEFITNYLQPKKYSAISNRKYRLNQRRTSCWKKMYDT
jgi:hypothetical protein